MARPPTVAVIGDGIAAEGSAHWALAEALGARLVEAGYRVLTGGLSGVMEAASRGAARSPAHAPGSIVGILPGDDPAAANPFVDVAIPTGLGHLRNALVARADAVVAVGGGAGTLSEIALAWVGRRLVLAFRVEGWSGRVADAPLDDRPRFSSIPDDRIFGVDSPDEAIRVLGEHLLRYLAARHGP
jgi:uncharacterized protein (TIGR00725 family)